jgi:hypothetical protein
MAANLSNINPELYEKPGNVGGESKKSGGTGNAGSKYGSSIESANLPTIGNITGGTTLESYSIPQGSLDNSIKLNNFTIPDAYKTIQEIANNSLYVSPHQHAALNDIYAAIDNLASGVKENRSRLDDYIMPANSVQDIRNKRNRLEGGDYFSNLINGFNG